MPLISIIIPTYNRADSLATAMRSILEQEVRDLELLVVDDGSTDQTYTMISAIGDPRIRYIKQANAGVCAARNRGIKEAVGEWVVFLDSDDRFLPGFFRSIADVLRAELDIVFVGANLLMDGKPNGVVIPSRPYGRPSDDGMFLAGMFVVRRKHLVEIGGYDEEITYGENTELSWRLKPQINQKAFIDTPFLEICQSSLRPSASPANLHHSINRILERHEAFFEVNPAIKFLYLNNLGVACMRLSLPREARTRFRQALAIRPFDFKTLIRIFVTLSPVWFQRLTYRRHQHRASENQRKPSEV